MEGRDSKLRIGIHLGEVVSEPDGDVYGDGVNTAARIQDEAEPGQVVVSEDVWRQIRQRSGYECQALGERALQGLEEPVRVYAVGGAPEEAHAEVESHEPPRRSERGRRIALASAVAVVVVVIGLVALESRRGGGRRPQKRPLRSRSSPSLISAPAETRSTSATA